jgi:hypothetical protein
VNWPHGWQPIDLARRAISLAQNNNFKPSIKVEKIVHLYHVLMGIHGYGCTMYGAPHSSGEHPKVSVDSNRKHARYELASLLLNERFDEAAHRADAYLATGVILHEDHTFVVKIVSTAKTIAHDN